MRGRHVLLIATMALLLGPTASALGQDAPPREQSASDREAQTRFEAGRMALEAGRFDDALADFLRAYELSERVELLYNIAVAHDRLRHDAEALEFFERYLAEAGPGGPVEEEVRGRIEVLRERLAETPEGTDPGTDDAGSTTAGWIVLAAGAAVTVAGGVLLGFGLADRATVEGAATGDRWADIQGAYDRGPILESVGIAALALGVAGVALGAVLVVTAGAGDSTEASVALGPGGLSLRGRF